MLKSLQLKKRRKQFTLSSSVKLQASGLICGFHAFLSSKSLTETGKSPLGYPFANASRARILACKNMRNYENATEIHVISYTL